ncbi:Metallothionein 3-like protein [Melia azedarach]|uniref:Metallothionein 3-like protein n=1 Tax=Melia azedarach TaxID=155640 RepID=A0ACC1YT21_MELAZ|nr:Metallothionein 3-like protein [Melia azedarach]
MSDTCGNCDCADKSQCVKKGSSYVADFVETESYVSAVVRRRFQQPRMTASASAAAAALAQTDAAALAKTAPEAAAALAQTAPEVAPALARTGRLMVLNY